MAGLHKVSWGLVWIGAINWGLVGIFGWNLVHAILGGAPLLERIVYILVGVAAVVMLFGCKSCKNCTGGMCKK